MLIQGKAQMLNGQTKFIRSSGRYFRKSRQMENKVINLLEGKQPHEVFELYVNEELKLKILGESNQYASQKKSLLDLTMLDLNTFNAIFMFTGYHFLLQPRMFREKEDDVGILIVYEAQSPNNFERMKTFTLFTDNNKLNVNDRFANVQMPYDKNK